MYVCFYGTCCNRRRTRISAHSLGALHIGTPQRRCATRAYSSAVKSRLTMYLCRYDNTESGSTHSSAVKSRLAMYLCIYDNTESGSTHSTGCALGSASGCLDILAQGIWRKVSPTVECFDQEVQFQINTYSQIRNVCPEVVHFWNFGVQLTTAWSTRHGRRMYVETDEVGASIPQIPRPSEVSARLPSGQGR
jgi:hypothetical protein